MVREMSSFYTDTNTDLDKIQNQAGNKVLVQQIRVL